MTPITHPLAIAHAEAYAAWAMAGRPEGGDLDRANDATHEAWEAAGFPLVADPPTNTVKVRIAVAVDPRGLWNCNGWQGASDAQVVESLDADGDRVTWITAHAYLPDPTPEVVGEVRGG